MARTILVVEDDRLNMRVFHDLLTSAGFETLEAGDAEGALELVARTRPDLALLDVQLPGMSGIDLIGRFKEDERLRTVPIIAVTALALRVHEKMIRAAGVDEYVIKPFSVANLMQVVRRYLPPVAAETQPEPEPEPVSPEQAADSDADEPRPWAVAPGFSLIEPGS